MYAVILTGGKQYRVEEGSRLKVEKIEAQVGEEIELNRILMLAKDNEIIIEEPFLKKARVVAEIIQQGRDRKIRIFKFKRRKNYRRRLGHRQPYTTILVKKIEYPGGAG